MSTSTEFLPRHSGLSLSDYYPRPSGAAVETAARDDRRVILRSLKNLTWIALFSLAVPALTLVDAQLTGGGPSEASATEIAQELLLLISAVVFWTAATRSVEMRPILQLAAGLFAAMLVRELDYFWDQVTHGFWVYPMTMVAAIAIISASQQRTSVLSAWAKYAQTKSYLLVLVGLLIVLVLSRTFGSQVTWRPILGDGNVALTKTVIQEGLELFGYLFVFWGAIEIAGSCPTRDRSLRGRLATVYDALESLFKPRPQV